MDVDDPPRHRLAEAVGKHLHVARKNHHLGPPSRPRDRAAAPRPRACCRASRGCGGTAGRGSRRPSDRSCGSTPRRRSPRAGRRCASDRADRFRQWPKFDTMIRVFMRSSGSWMPQVMPKRSATGGKPARNSSGPAVPSITKAMRAKNRPVSISSNCAASTMLHPCSARYPATAATMPARDSHWTVRTWVLARIWGSSDRGKLPAGHDPIRDPRQGGDRPDARADRPIDGQSGNSARARRFSRYTDGNEATDGRLLVVDTPALSPDRHVRPANPAHTRDRWPYRSVGGYRCAVSATALVLLKLDWPPPGPGPRWSRCPDDVGPLT